MLWTGACAARDKSCRHKRQDRCTPRWLSLHPALEHFFHSLSLKTTGPHFQQLANHHYSCCSRMRGRPRHRHYNLHGHACTAEPQGQPSKAGG